MIRVAVPRGRKLVLPPSRFASRNENPFDRTMETSLSACLRDLNIPAYLLTHQMQMAAGTMLLSNDIILEDKLRDRPGPALTEMPEAQELNFFDGPKDNGDVHSDE